MTQTKATTPPRHELITRNEIMTITGVSKSKVINATNSKKHKFPKIICNLAFNEAAYAKKEVLAWLEKNDLKTIRFAAYNLASEKKQESFNNSLAVAFLSGKLTQS